MTGPLKEGNNSSIAPQGNDNKLTRRAFVDNVIIKPGKFLAIDELTGHALSVAVFTGNQLARAKQVPSQIDQLFSRSENLYEVLGKNGLKDFRQVQKADGRYEASFFGKETKLFPHAQETEFTFENISQQEAEALGTLVRLHPDNIRERIEKVVSDIQNKAVKADNLPEVIGTIIGSVSAGRAPGVAGPKGTTTEDSPVEVFRRWAKAHPGTLVALAVGGTVAGAGIAYVAKSVIESMRQSAMSNLSDPTKKGIASPVPVVPVDPEQPKNPEPTPIPTVKAREAGISAREWAKGKENGGFDQEQMFPVIGAVDMKHHKTVDLQLGSLKLAALTDQDLTKTDAGSVRKSVAEKLNADAGLKKLITAVKKDLTSGYSAFKEDELVFVVENGALTQVVTQRNDQLIRFKVESENGAFNLAEWKEYNLLPSLKVEGAYIVRRDIVTGEERKIELKGVNILNFQDVESPTFASAKKYIDTAYQWGSNFIRFQLDLAKFENNENNIAELGKTLDYLESKGMYAVLSPALYGKIGFRRPADEIKRIMPFLTDQFKNRKNVMFGLLNEIEPSKRFAGEIIPGLIEIATAIRQANPDAVLVVPGFIWNKDFSVFVEPNVFPFDNVIFDLHYYMHLDGGNDITNQVLNISGILGKRPILIGEAGVASHLGGQNNPNDKVYINKALDLMRNYPKMAHYTGFAMSKGGQGPLINNDFSPSNRGKLYFDDMQDPNSVQQTYFTK